jgi:hypothetical protein
LFDNREYQRLYKAAQRKADPGLRELERERSKAYYAANKDKWKDYNKDAKPKRRKRDIFSKYGLTAEQVDDMLASQGGKCAICLTPDPGGRYGTFHIDHCHTTGKVRGLLCHSCNTSLGHFKDDAAVIRRAANYVEKAVE